MRTKLKLRKFSWFSTLLVLTTLAIPKQSSAQDQDQEDPPSRVARLGYMEGSVSFQPAGEEDWVGAVDNRPMTTGDKLWADKDSRAEVQLGSAVIRLAPETGFSFLNLDDSTVQIQLTSGSISITVRNLENNDDFEVDTPNLAFTVSQPGHYRFDASEDGSNTVVTIREGEGQATGNGQTYTLHAGQAGTFSGTDSLTADVEQIGNADQFDSWSESRDHRHDYSRSSHYLAPDVVGFDDLDDNGDWRDDSNYGHVWFPNHVDEGWAPYHEGHWDWISPWGWTWVDDSSWGYAPFHYGRWVSVSGRWGWVAGPVAVHAVYAPALVVFIGGGPGGFGGNVGWFPLGPREVYVPSYHVSEAYVNRVNVSNTTVNVTQVTNVYNTTIVHNTTNITNVTYANRGVQGAVMVVPQHAFTSAQPVAKARVQVSPQQIAAAPVSGRVAVAPTRESVLGAKAATAGHVTAPPAAVASRQVVAKKTPPPPPVPFAKQQQALAAHPGQPLARHEVQSLRPANTAASHPMVKQAPPGKPATPTTGHPANSGRPGQPASASPANQPRTPPADANERPAEPNRPAPAQPNNRPQPTQPNNRPEATPNRPAPTQPNNRPPTPQPNKPEATPNRPPSTQPSRPEETPNRPPAAQPNKPEAAPNRPPAAQPNNRPEPAHSTPAPARNDRPPAAQPAPRQTPPPSERPQQHTPPPAAAKPAPAPPKQQPKPQTPEEKKKQEEQKRPQ
ncbi:MAG TPA: DUF6600 domain-containing protein [Candidatus Polarisedimenticolia bacterium]|nr:DUF6600 domain-containing protein [Candidatus Polarisedimenticolia bacterium]